MKYLEICLLLWAYSVVSQVYEEFPYWRTDQPTWYCPQNYEYDKMQCPPGSPRGWNCWDPPWYPYDETHVVLPDYGKVIGRTLMTNPHRYVNLYLGIPYAKPPIGNLRFKPTERPGTGWDQGILEWDASCYRPACPQEIWKLQDKFVETRNMSEDCLYLNIFRPNFTDRTPDENKNYAVMVFIHGEDFKLGDAMLYPGHVLAEKEIIAVTFNYRLGVLGFLSTEDQHSRGNYGLYDQLQVLKFIKENIHLFGGDPARVTIAGVGSGAASVGLHIVSPLSRYYFNRAIAMSGSDLCEWARSDVTWSPREYANALGKKVGCDYEGQSVDRMVECFRRKSWEDLVNATASMYQKWGSLAGPFAPVVDMEGGFLPRPPKEARDRGDFAKVDYMSGLCRDSGAYIALNASKAIKGLKLDNGLDPIVLRELIYRFVRDRFIYNVDEVASAIEFQYTYWARPDNTTATRQNYLDLWSDYAHGWCVDEALKYHANTTAYMYLFHYRSEFEPQSNWMGVPYHKDADYVFGQPFFNETLGNLTGLIPDQFTWTYMDKNISHFMQEMWVNFTRFGMPTTQYSRNVTFWPFSHNNLSYLYINELSFMDINYRQNYYAFWRNYFPAIKSRYPLTTTPIPTPRPRLALQASTFGLGALTLIVIITIGALTIANWKKSKQEPLLS